MIRELKEQDRKEFVAMCRDFYTSSAVDHPVNDNNFHTTFDTILQQSPYCTGHILEWEGQIAGYGLLSFTYSNEVAGLVVLLEELYLKKDYRSKGLGKEYFAYVFQLYADKAKRFRLEVTKTNSRAYSLYRRLGFQDLEYLQMIADMDGE